MSEDSNNITYIINNYFFIHEDNKTTSLFQPVYKNISSRSYFSQIKKGPENKIILTDEQMGNALKCEINLDKKENKIEDNLISKTSVSSIDIKNDTVSEKNECPKETYFKTDNSKKVGRKRKTSSDRATHTKFSEDNILRKIKVKFLHKLTNYVNSIILSKYGNQIRPLKHLKGKISQNNGVNYNKKLLFSNLRDIFSSNEINGKYKLFEKFYNKEVIQKIYEDNITELIEILETSFIDAFKIFRNYKDDSTKMIGLEKINIVVEEMKNKEKDEEYINKFVNVANDFENRYLKKIGRK